LQEVFISEQKAIKKTLIPLPWRGARKGGVVAYRHNKLSKHKSLKDRNSIGGNHPGALRHPSIGGNHPGALRHPSTGGE